MMPLLGGITEKKSKLMAFLKKRNLQTVTKEIGYNTRLFSGGRSNL